MGQLHELVIAKDQDIKAAIEAFVLEKGWQNVYISGAIGSVYGLEFTTPADSSQPGLHRETLSQKTETNKQTNKQTKSFKKLSLVSLSRDWKETSCSQRIPCVLSLIRLY